MEKEEIRASTFKTHIKYDAVRWDRVIVLQVSSQYRQVLSQVPSQDQQVLSQVKAKKS